MTVGRNVLCGQWNNHCLTLSLIYMTLTNYFYLVAVQTHLALFYSATQKSSFTTGENKSAYWPSIDYSLQCKVKNKAYISTLHTIHLHDTPIQYVDWVNLSLRTMTDMADWRFHDSPVHLFVIVIYAPDCIINTWQFNKGVPHIQDTVGLYLFVTADIIKWQTTFKV